MRSSTTFLFGFLCRLLIPLALLAAPPADAQEDVCAVVKIEIRQELTLERQAFEARMRITNGLDTLALEGVDINVTFEDESGNPVLASSDPNDTSAAFFIRLDRMEGISDVSGSGVIPPKGVAEITWLIIPAQGAGGSGAQGVLYGVGASLDYRFGGESEQVIVTPDVIRVRPMPLLTLDYFLPESVFGDDPQTPTEEQAEPFNLGVRVGNTGAGAAKALRIESAQPKIVENNQGLLVDFSLLGSSVNDAPVQNTLLADFGDIDPGASKVARWVMTSSLSGSFLSFDAEYVHRDAFGGALTSLLDAVRTHTLVRNVRVDLPGRDAVRDFLARDGATLRVYESEGGDASVHDLSAAAALQRESDVGGRPRYRLALPSSDGLRFARVADPNPASDGDYSAWRSDGKPIDAANIWRFRELDGAGGASHWIGIFDTTGPTQFELRFSEAVTGNLPPQLSVPTSIEAQAGALLSIPVEATDPEGQAVAVNLASGPEGMLLSAVSGTQWKIEWTPSAAQVGTHAARLRASDGQLHVEVELQVTVRQESSADSDGDGLDDDWEREHFGDLSRDGTGDFDQDGASDRAEHDHGGDPTLEDRPGRAAILAPFEGGQVTTLPMDFVFQNAQRAADAELTYRIELIDPTDPLAPSLLADATEQPVETVLSLSPLLEEGRQYVWRVGADDGATPGDWTYGGFGFGNPSTPRCAAAFPVGSGRVDAPQPRLSVRFSRASAEQVVFEIAEDPAFDAVLARSAALGWARSNERAWRSDVALPLGQPLYWRALRQASASGTAQTCSGGMFEVVDASAPQGYRLEVPEVDADSGQIRVPISGGTAAEPTWRYELQIDASPEFASEALVTLPLDADPVGNAEALIDELPRGRELWARVRASTSQVDGEWIYSQFQLSPAAGDLLAPLALSPRHGTWAPSLSPALGAMTADGLAASFRFQLFADAALSDLVAEISSTSGIAEMPSRLDDRRRYWWRVRTETGTGAQGPWSDAQSFFTIDDGVDQAPEFAWESLLADVEARPGPVALRWRLSDPDSAATLDLFYEDSATGEIGEIASVLTEQDAGRIEWIVGPPLVGRILRVGARVGDGQHESLHYAPGTLRVAAPGLVWEIVASASSESGDAAQARVRLRAMPQDLVGVTLSVSDTSEATIEPGSLQFSPDDWQQPRTVRLIGVDDQESDGNQPIAILWGPIVSEDHGYSGLSGSLDGFTNVDNDSASIVMSAEDLPLMTSEEGGAAEISVRLGTQPLGPVTLTLATDRPDEVVVSPEQLTFTADNWVEAQSVLVVGLDDAAVDGDAPFVVAVASVQTDDPSYAAAALPELRGINLDDERVAVSVSPATPLQLRSGQTGQRIAVALNAAPESSVEVQISVDPATAVELSSSALSFDSSSWDQPQQVEVSAAMLAEISSFTIRFDSSNSEDARFAAADPVLIEGVVLPAPTAVGFEIGRAPASVWRTGEVVRVPLSAVFASAPIVAVTWVSSDATPALAQVVASDAAGFDVVVLRAEGGGEVTLSGAVNFAAAEPGHHGLPDGRGIYAARMEVSDVQGLPASSWATLTFAQPFESAPIVLASPQSRRNATWLTAALGGVNTNSVQLALDVGASGQAPSHAEQIGVIAFEADAMSSAHLGAETYEYETQRVEARVGSTGAGCTRIPHATTRTEAPLVLATRSDRQSGSGWVKVCNESASFAALAVESDRFAGAPPAGEPASVGLMTASRPVAMQLEGRLPTLILDQHLGLRTYPDGHGVAFSIRLSAPPESAVSVPVRSTEAGVRAVPALLEFGASNWSTPQWVRVEAADDAVNASTLAVQVGPSASADPHFDQLAVPPVTIVQHARASWTRILDNTDAGFSSIGNWASSRSVGGYYGSNYLFHAANGESPDALVVDNGDSGFSSTGVWTASTAVAGYWGSNYLYRQRGEPQEAALLDDPAARYEGDWNLSTAVAGYQGSGYRTAPSGDGSRRAVWAMQGLPTDTYRVLVRWTAHANRADNAPYTITHREGSETVRVNQRQSGARWVELGVYALDGSSEIALSNAANGYVIADAIKLISTSAPPNAAVWQAQLPTSGDYEVFARWTAHANRASNAVYSVNHADGRADVVVNQSQTGASWVSLGSYRFQTEQPAQVSLSDQADGYVIADAVRFVPLVARANEAEWLFSSLPLGEYTVSARWTAHANRASNAQYRLAGLLGEQIAIANQRVLGGAWNLLGSVNAAPEAALALTLGDRADGYVIADAIRVEDQAVAGPRGSRLVDDVTGRAEGAWSTSTSVGGYLGSGYRAAPSGNGDRRFIWPLPAAADTYRVYARWTAGSNRATDATYRVAHASGVTPVVVNQRERGGQWILLGEFALGALSQVTLDNAANGYVIADAIRVEPARYPEATP
jgi:hypothetical protein